MLVSHDDECLLRYSQLQQGNMLDANDAPDMGARGEQLRSLCDTINSTSPQDLERRVSQTDFDAAIDLGMRFYTGCTVPESKERAERLWTAVLEIQSPRALPSQRGIACSLIANLHYENFRQRALQSDFEKAITHALFSVESNPSMRTPGVLRICMAMDQHGLRNKSPYNLPLTKPLWDMYDNRIREHELEERKRNRKVRKQPNAYVCANCAIRATSRTALRKCAGLCNGEDKPSYCSKECQKADWPSHKPDCKPEKNSSKEGSRYEQSTPKYIPRYEIGTLLDPSEAAARPKGKEYRTTLQGPNGPVEILSKTMTPTLMREFKVNEFVSQNAAPENSDNPWEVD